jgi:RES domain-containing protein
LKASRAESAFDGEGAFRYGGRWNSRGHRAVYASSTLSLALLEFLVHLDPAAQIPKLVALSICVAVADIKQFKPSAAEPNTMTFPWDLRQTREYGDNWLQPASSPALQVPSSIVSIESHFLINPHHPKFKSYTISAPQPFLIDPRF